MKDAKGREKLEDYPDVLIEQAVLGELDPRVQAEIEALPGFGELKARRLAENAAILDQYKPEDLLESIRTRALRTETREREDDPKLIKIATTVRRVFLGAVPVAAVALVILFVARGNATLIGDDGGTRVKGTVSASPVPVAQQNPKLEIWRKHDTRAEVLEPGATVRPNDKLQIAYQAGASRYGMIVSIDGAGKMSLHYPEALSVSPDLDPAGTVVLPYAYELDTAPYFERFLFITSKRPFITSDIWTSIEKQLRDNRSWAENGYPRLPEDVQVSGFLLRK